MCGLTLQKITARIFIGRLVKPCRIKESEKMKEYVIKQRNSPLTEPKPREPVAPRNYRNPEPLNTSHIGKSVSITLTNGRIESGKLKTLGAYMLSLEGSNGRELIINKGAILTVSIL